MAAGLMARPAIAYGSAMPANLLIVESPSKAKTLKKYLGSDFEILASYGHIRDLVPKNGAVDPDKNFAMKYQIIAKNSKHVDAIAAAVTNQKVQRFLLDHAALTSVVEKE
jgi:DNA topoisomerase IA